MAVQLICKARDWKEEAKPDAAQLLWTSTQTADTYYPLLRRNVFINHLPNIHLCVDKCVMGNRFNALKRLMPDEYSFFPVCICVYLLSLR
jgi:hypothetical protein